MKNVRHLPRAEYEAERRIALREQPRLEMAPRDRPLPSDAMAMTPEAYTAAKRAITKQAQK